MVRVCVSPDTQILRRFLTEPSSSILFLFPWSALPKKPSKPYASTGLLTQNGNRLILLGSHEACLRYCEFVLRIELYLLSEVSIFGEAS